MKKKHIEQPVFAVIGKGMRLDAEMLSGKGIVRIEGEYFGDMKIDGELILAQSGHISGNISVNSADIAGSITGNISCARILHIKTTGKIKGDIESEAILMDEGAIFNGFSRMSEPAPERHDPFGIGAVLNAD